MNRNDIIARILALSAEQVELLLTLLRQSEAEESASEPQHQTSV